jgi:hypothetical protein
MTCAAHCLAADSPTLTYAFKSGERYVYDVQIEAQTLDVDEKLSGESSYKVMSIDANSGQITLVHSAGLTQTRRQRPGRPLGPPPWTTGIIRDLNRPREVVIDPAGHVVRQQTKSELPYRLGNIWSLAIVPFEKGQEKWQVQRDIQLTDAQIEYWLPRSREDAREVARPAKEIVDFAIGEKKADLLNIETKYAMATVEQLEGLPRLELKGAGTIEFDTKLGIIRSLQEKLTLRCNDPNITIKVPVSVSVKWLSPEQVAQRRAAQEAQMQRLAIEGPKAAAAARQAAEESRKPKPIDNPGLNAALAAIQQQDKSKVLDALRTLSASAPIDARRPEVARVLVGLIDQVDDFVHLEAIKALGRWGTVDDVPRLIKLLDDKDIFIRSSAIEALALTQDPRAAQALAAQMEDFQLRLPAAEALKSMGAMGEKAIWPLLKHKNWELRLQACEILSEIGTEKSQQALAALAQDDNPLVVQSAANARRQIEERKN